MPQRAHTRFDDKLEQPQKKQKVERSGTSDAVPHSRDEEAGSGSTAWIEPKKRGRKAPSQIARSNRRALKFKNSLGEDLNGSSQGARTALPEATSDNSLAHTKGTVPYKEQLGRNSVETRHESNIVTSFKPKASHGNPNSGNLKAKAEILKYGRQSLPIWPHAEDIRKSLRDRNVLLLVGETGSGKSTQVPQFLLTEPWCCRKDVSVSILDKGNPAVTSLKSNEKRNIKVGGCIAITEPRRVAATTLARRVADELGTPLGKASPASIVGYSVRFDDNTSPSTKVKFVTEGMLLQEMLRDPWLTRYSAIIVDEVHERGVNVDLLLGFLRRLLTRISNDFIDGRGGVPLKVVVMSATAEGSELVKFFQDGFDQTTSDFDHVQQESTEADVSEWSGLSDSESLNNTENTKDEVSVPQSTKNVAALYFRGRQHPVKIIHSPQPVPDVLEACLVRVFAINYQEPLPGDILIFLTGQKAVESLCTLVEEYSGTLSKSLPKLLPLPLFAALPQEAQRRVFDPTPAPAKGQRGIRKIIISTNIAETSVTVPGVRYVIDGGKEKVKQFRPRIGLDSLLTKSISHSSAIQRTGRAGREAPGNCYRLYTESDFARLAERAPPEILRCDLAQAVLALMARGVAANEVGSFPLLTVPPRDSLKAALVNLHQIGAVDDHGQATESGVMMAGLPVGASMAKALMKAAEPNMNCLADMIDLVSAMSGEGIFVLGNDEDDEGLDTEQQSRREDLWRRDGDHFTMIMAVRGFAAEHGDRRKWAEARGLSWRAMRGIMDIRKQLLELKARLSAEETTGQSEQQTNLTAPISPNVVRCLLAGFPLNAAILAPDGSYRTVSGRQTVAIHPSSVLFRRVAGANGSQQGKPAAIVYTEFVYTTRAYARGVSPVEVDWIIEALGADWGKLDNE